MKLKIDQVTLNAVTAWIKRAPQQRRIELTYGARMVHARLSTPTNAYFGSGHTAEEAIISAFEDLAPGTSFEEVYR